MYRIFLDNTDMTTFQAFNGLFDMNQSAHLFLDDDRVVWINGSLVCQKLGFKNVTQTVLTKTDEDERQLCDVGAINDAWFISEYGVWGIILSSKKKAALELKRFLKHEVLPSIRSQGVYISESATSAQLAIASARIAELEAQLEQGFKNEIAIKVVDFLCDTESPNGDPLVHMDYLKSENRKLRGLAPVAPELPQRRIQEEKP